MVKEARKESAPNYENSTISVAMPAYLSFSQVTIASNFSLNLLLDYFLYLFPPFFSIGKFVSYSIGTAATHQTSQSLHVVPMFENIRP